MQCLDVRPPTRPEGPLRPDGISTWRSTEKYHWKAYKNEEMRRELVASDLPIAATESILQRRKGQRYTWRISYHKILQRFHLFGIFPLGLGTGPMPIYENIHKVCLLLWLPEDRFFRMWSQFLLKVALMGTSSNAHCSLDAVRTFAH